MFIWWCCMHSQRIRPFQATMCGQLWTQKMNFISPWCYNYTWKSVWGQTRQESRKKSEIKRTNDDALMSVGSPNWSPKSYEWSNSGSYRYPPKCMNTKVIPWTRSTSTSHSDNTQTDTNGQTHIEADRHTQMERKTHKEIGTHSWAGSGLYQSWSFVMLGISVTSQSVWCKATVSVWRHSQSGVSVGYGIYVKSHSVWCTVAVSVWRHRWCKVTVSAWQG